jgi:BRCT domain type II-containing protein
MNEEELKELVGKKVKVICLYVGKEPIIYRGVIKKVNNGAVTIVDKFGNLVLLDSSIITEVVVLGDNDV